MRITQDSNTNAHTIHSYDTGKITIVMPSNGLLPHGARLLGETDATANKPQAFEWFKSVLITPSNIHSDWKPQHHSELTIDDFTYIFARKPEVLLLGTGKNLVFPPANIMALFAEKKIGLEVMGTAAACRTYNFLINDNRDVAAALFMI